ncbi:MAG: serine/threonine-protein kinase [Bryobacteraceae bacterium]
MDLPARIGKYELQEFLGGGMSHVYRAQDTVLGRTVAVKILTESGCADAETKARFLQEARTAGSFTHDNIISVFDFGEDQGRPFIIMEFLRGESLRDAIKNGHTGDLRSKLHIALQISRSLDYIHSKRIIHRDIKPDNIHVDLQQRVKLMDFGIAKSHNVALTRVGFTLGTPYYMAPEQVLGQQVTTLVDVYAFGILMFELFTGVKPIGGDSIDKVFMQILQEPLNLAPLRQTGAPQSIVEMVERCTAKMPQQRIQGFGAITVELERMIEEQAPAATPDRTGLGPAMAPVSAKWETPVPPPPVVPRAPVTRPPTVASAPPPVAAPAAVEAADSLPGFMQILPEKYRTQEWFIGIVAVGVIFGMVILVLLLRLLLRIVS